jgi:hypothetical protein
VLWPLAVYFAIVIALVVMLLGLSALLGERHRERATVLPYGPGIVSTVRRATTPPAWWCRRVGDLCALDPGPRRERVGSRPDGVGDLAHLDTSGQQRVGDQRPMATPQHGFRAHQHHALVFRESNTPIQTVRELRRLHVIGIATEAGVAPRGVRRVRSRMAQATQSRQVPIVNPRAMQSRRQSAATELRIVTRSRNRAHVDHALDPMRLEQSDERGERTCGVPDREDDERGHLDVPITSQPGARSARALTE